MTDLDKTAFKLIMNHSQNKVNFDKYYKVMNGTKINLGKNLEQGIEVFI